MALVSLTRPVKEHL